MNVVKRPTNLNLSILKTVNHEELSDENHYYLNSLPENYSKMCLSKLEDANKKTKIKSIPSFMHSIITRTMKDHNIVLPPYKYESNFKKPEISKPKETPTKEVENKKRKRHEDTQIDLGDIDNSLLMEMEVPEITPSQPIPTFSFSQKRIVEDTLPTLQETQDPNEDEEDIIISIPKQTTRDFPPINENFPEEIKGKILILREKVIKQRKDFEKLLKKI